MYLKYFVCFIIYFLISYTSGVDSNEGNVQQLVVRSNDMNEYPYIVQISHKGEYFMCFGTIISHFYVLSSAFCIGQKHTQPEDIFVYSGRTELPVNVKAYKVQKIYIHPHYNYKQTEASANWPVYDFAFLEMKEKIVYLPKVQPIKIAGINDADNFDSMIEGRAVCHSFVWNSHGSSMNIDMIQIYLFREEECHILYKGSDNHQFCAITSNSPQSPQVRFGAPLVCDGKVFGLHLKTNSKESAAELFTRVDRENCLIEKIIKTDELLPNNNCYDNNTDENDHESKIEENDHESKIEENDHESKIVENDHHDDQSNHHDHNDDQANHHDHHDDQSNHHDHHHDQSKIEENDHESKIEEIDALDFMKNSNIFEIHSFTVNNVFKKVVGYSIAVSHNLFLTSANAIRNEKQVHHLYLYQGGHERNLSANSNKYVVTNMYPVPGNDNFILFKVSDENALSNPHVVKSSYAENFKQEYQTEKLNKTCFTVVLKSNTKDIPDLEDQDLISKTALSKVSLEIIDGSICSNTKQVGTCIYYDFTGPFCIRQGTPLICDNALFTIKTQDECTLSSAPLNNIRVSR